MMKCDNYLCIYQSNEECLLNEIRIDAFGMCTECIYPDFNEEILNEAKLKLLNKYEKDREEDID